MRVFYVKIKADKKQYEELQSKTAEITSKIFNTVILEISEAKQEQDTSVQINMIRSLAYKFTNDYIKTITYPGLMLFNIFPKNECFDIAYNLLEEVIELITPLTITKIKDEITKQIINNTRIIKSYYYEYFKSEYEYDIYFRLDKKIETKSQLENYINEFKIDKRLIYISISENNIIEIIFKDLFKKLNFSAENFIYSYLQTEFESSYSIQLKYDPNKLRTNYYIKTNVIESPNILKIYDPTKSENFNSIDKYNLTINRLAEIQITITDKFNNQIILPDSETICNLKLLKNV